MNDSLISDSFALATGGLGFTRVRIESQTERISHLGSRLFQIFMYFFNFYLIKLLFENCFDLLRFEPAPVLTNAFDRLATLKIVLI